METSVVDAQAVRTFLTNFNDTLCSQLESLDGNAQFTDDVWQRAEGGGGVTRVPDRDFFSEDHHDLFVESEALIEVISLRRSYGSGEGITVDEVREVRRGSMRQSSRNSGPFLRARAPFHQCQSQR